MRDAVGPTWVGDECAGRRIAEEPRGGKVSPMSDTAVDRHSSPNRAPGSGRGRGDPVLPEFRERAELGPP